MPIYGFKCSSCGAEEDRLLKISHTQEDLKLITCPVCDTIMDKQVSSGNFLLQGTDYYKPSAYQPKYDKG